MSPREEIEDKITRIERLVATIERKQANGEPIEGLQLTLTELKNTLLIIQHYINVENTN